MIISCRIAQNQSGLSHQVQHIEFPTSIGVLAISVVAPLLGSGPEEPGHPKYDVSHLQGFSTTSRYPA